MPKSQFPSIGELGSFKDFEMGEMKFPESQIGEAAASFKPASEPPSVKPMLVVKPSALPPGSPPKSSKAPLPPPLRPHADFRGDDSGVNAGAASHSSRYGILGRQHAVPPGQTGVFALET
jgi:hypothetical protein